MRRTFIIWLVTLCGATLCLGGGISEPEQRIIDQLELASVPDREINLAEAALAIGSTVFPDADIQKYLDRIDKMAGEIADGMKSGVKNASEQERTIAAINQYLYKNVKIKSESIVQDTKPTKPPEVDRNKFLLNRVIDNLNGNCLGLTTLYWSLAERLNLDLQAVVIPMHVFLRYNYSSNKYRNIEATSSGAELSDEEYVKMVKELMKSGVIPQYSTPAEFRFQTVSKEEFIGLILYNRGVDYTKRNLPEYAVTDFSNSIKLAPEFANSYKNRGVHYMKQGKHLEAARDLRQAVRLEPDCPMTHFNLGVAYLNINEFIDARKNFDKVIELAPDYASAHLNLGVVYDKLKQPQLALKSIDKAIELVQSGKTLDDEQNDTSRAYYNRGLIYFDLKQYAEAINDYTRAIELNGASSDAYHNRGLAYAMLERFRDATGDMEKALELLGDTTNRQRTDLLRNLGIAYYKAGEYKNSLERLEQYLELKPDDKEIARMVESVREKAK